MSRSRDDRDAGSDRAALDTRLLWLMLAVKALLHIPSLFRYGYFRDELYFLDCGRHLAFGYVDHAPLVGLYAKVALLMGGSLPALRMLPLAAGLGLVALAMALTAELGGRRFAQSVAALAVIVAPVILMMDSVMTMNAFEPLFWTAAILIVVRIVRSGNSRLWLLFGLIAGLGLENKHSMLFFGAAVAVGVLLTPLRRELARPWIWLGLAIAAVLFMPNLLWQWRHGFPTLEDLHNVAASGKNVVLGPASFLVEQTLMVHPVTLPIWLAGLVHVMLGRGSRFRILGWTFLVVAGTMLVLHGKSYYLAPGYPMLFAAGAVAIEGWLAGLSSARWSSRFRVVALAVIIAAGALLAPIALPILEPQQLVAYQEAIGVGPSKTEVHHEGPLPQLWGDQFGWPELVRDVAAVYWSLPAEERRTAGIFAGNYGEAGAINLFGPDQALPPAICAHQTHFFWGPPDEEPGVIIWVQWRREWLEGLCGTVEEAGAHHHPWGMAEENRPIYLCRDPVAPLREMWPELKHWN